LKWIKATIFNICRSAKPGLTSIKVYIFRRLMLGVVVGCRRIHGALGEVCIRRKEVPEIHTYNWQSEVVSIFVK
jgi:hypothetical protein